MENLLLCLIINLLYRIKLTNGYNFIYRLCVVLLSNLLKENNNYAVQLSRWPQVAPPTTSFTVHI